MRPALDGSDGDFQNLGDRRLLQTNQVIEGDDFAVSHLKTGHGCAQNFLAESASELICRSLRATHIYSEPAQTPIT
jgi:hypothetical protein